MKHVLYVTLVPPEDTDWEATFEERTRLTELMEQSEGIRSIGGGQMMTFPMMADLDFEVESAGTGAALLVRLVAELTDGWAMTRVSMNPLEGVEPDPSNGGG